MTILQVKQYHREIAERNYQQALERWRERGYGFPVLSMFFFYREDRKGYPTTKRLNGYVAFDDHRYCFGLNRNKAIERFNKC